MAGIDYWLDNRRYRLDGASVILYRGVDPVKLGPVPCTILLYLAQHRDRYINVAELVKVLRVHIAPITYRVHIRNILEAIGRTLDGGQFIISDRHGGRKFIANVVEVPQRDIEELGAVPRSRTVLVPQPAGDTFLYDDLTWYERERARLINIGGDISGPHGWSSDAGSPQVIPLGTVWQTNVEQLQSKMKRLWTSIGTTSFEGAPVCLLASGPDIMLLDATTINYVCTARNGKMHEIVRPNEGVFSWPLLVGKVWEASFSYTNYIDRRAIASVVSRYEVTAYEDISVPAGEFRAFKIEGTPVSRESVWRIAWYAPEPGIVVKREWTRDETDYRGVPIKTVMELIRYPMNNN